MHAAIIDQSGAVPVHGMLPDPVPADGFALVRVSAAALSHVTRSRASGRHYSTGAASHVVPGVDGVGRVDDGRRVYFLLPEAPHGSMAELSVVDPRHCIALPENVDDVTAAAIAIPAMSSWAALRERAKFAAGGTVLVNGATGASGCIAVQVAKRLGAKKVVATGRNADTLAHLKTIGADVAIALSQSSAALDRALRDEFASGVDVVLDYLWGASAEAILAAAVRAAPEAVPIRYVQIGAVSGDTIALPSAALRSSSIELLGSGMNSVPKARLIAAIRDVFASASQAAFDLPIDAVPLQRIGELWSKPEGSPRIVFTMGR